MRFPPVVLLVAALGLLAPAACTRVGGTPGAPKPAPLEQEATPAPEAVRYAGLVTLSGRRLPVVLEVRRDTGSSAEAELRIPDLGMVARGRGSWRQDGMTLELAYGDGCPGTVRLELAPGPSGGLEGTLQARDCTGEARGPVALEARRA